MNKVFKVNHKDQQGEKNSQSKLTWDQVKELRKLKSEGASLCRKYDIGRSTVHQIVMRYRWNYED